MIQSNKLDALVRDKYLLGYSFDIRDDTGTDAYYRLETDAYYRLELVFPNGEKVVIIPEGETWDHVERIGIY